MRMAERTTPVLAVIAVLSTLSCCLPLTFLGALGLAGASARLQSFRPCLGSAAVLLGIGFIQLYVRRNQCEKRSLLSIALFWSAALIVLLVILFPQVLASLIAGQGHANAKSQIRALAGRDRCCVRDRLVSLAVKRNATRSTPAHITDTKQPRPV